MLSKISTWFLLFNKRLFKNFSFLLLFISVIFITLFFRFSSSLESGIVSVAVCIEKNEESRLSAELLEELKGSRGILHFVQVESRGEGEKKLLENEVQAVWLFDSELEKTIKNSAESDSIQPLVTIIERQDTVFLKFSREILFSKIFPYLSRFAYNDYVKNTIKITQIDSDSLDSYYEQYLYSTPLIKIRENNGGEVEEKLLLSPLRGLLALWILICSLAAALHFLSDYEKGIFVWVARKNQLFLALGMNGIVVFDVAVVFLLCLMAGGIFTNPVSELVNLALYGIATVLFSTFFLLLFKKIQRLSFVLAPLVIANLVFTPVFINLPMFKTVSRLFPAFYYLNGIYDFSYTVNLIFYIILLSFFNFLLSKLKI